MSFLAKKLPKNEGAGSGQGSGQGGRRLDENEQNRQSTNCCKWCSSSINKSIYFFLFKLKSQI